MGQINTNKSTGQRSQKAEMGGLRPFRRGRGYEDGVNISRRRSGGSNSPVVETETVATETADIEIAAVETPNGD
jgi:hypothetical protein